jgi:hypothetical protein
VLSEFKNILPQAVPMYLSIEKLTT